MTLNEANTRKQLIDRVLGKPKLRIKQSENQKINGIKLERNKRQSVKIF